MCANASRQRLRGDGGGPAIILGGKSATSYPGALNREGFPEVEVLDAPVVLDGKVIRSRGSGTAMDFPLQLVEYLVGTAKRDEVEIALVR